ncbi:MAG: UDP-N-acetylglucosamine 2-epimerase, partial [Candidatus Daviesbacteria bacterium GW2011_GWF2_38_6]
MKTVISVVGARPNFMKVAPIYRAFKKYEDKVKHLIVHTGQHYDKTMSDAFFQDLEMPHPDYFLGVGSGSHAVQTSKIMVEFEKVCIESKPDLVLVVGDVNSTIACALTAIKLDIKVAHIESGLRSRDRSMPEEINRIATDSICDYCFVTEQSGLDNLKKEGFDTERVFYTGNTMIDSQFYALENAKKSEIVKKLNLNPKEYILITLHRPSNVDEKEQLKQILEIFNEISD